MAVRVGVSIYDSMSKFKEELTPVIKDHRLDLACYNWRGNTLELRDNKSWSNVTIARLQFQYDSNRVYCFTHKSNIQIIESALGECPNWDIVIYSESH